MMWPTPPAMWEKLTVVIAAADQAEQERGAVLERQPAEHAGRHRLPASALRGAFCDDFRWTTSWEGNGPILCRFGG